MSVVSIQSGGMLGQEELSDAAVVHHHGEKTNYYSHRKSPIPCRPGIPKVANPDRETCEGKQCHCKCRNTSAGIIIK